MKLLEILQKELKEFPEGMLYAVQDDDGEVKFGKHSHPTLCVSGIWQRREDGICPSIAGLELSEDWDSTIVTKEMWDTFRVKSKMVNTSQQGHVHAEMIALCAEFAKTMEDPMTMFQRSYEGNMWIECAEVEFKIDWKYRLKPKTKLINGVEIPDLSFTPFVGCEFYCANIGLPEFYETGYMGSEGCTFTKRMVERGLIYPYTEEGKQAAILHAKAMLGIA